MKYRYFHYNHQNQHPMYKHLIPILLLLWGLISPISAQTMPLEKLQGSIPADICWQNGVYWTEHPILKGQTVTCYQYGPKKILVVRYAKTKMVSDIWIEYDRTVNSLMDQRLELLQGVYQNETGYAVFGNIEEKNKDYQNCDPGDDIHFHYDIGPAGIVVSDTIEWGFKRIQQVNPPPGAPPGWGGAGAFTGPTLWKINFEGNELHVVEVLTGINAPTYPAFGKDFKLKKVRSPYAHAKDPWAIAAYHPLTRGSLSMLTPELLKAILAEIKSRHADGTELFPIEKLNKSLIETLIEERTPKQASKKTSVKKSNSKKKTVKKKNVKKSRKKKR